MTEGYYARVVADSVSSAGHRLTTFEVRFHRFVLAEFNTHRVLSKNSASSRAIPVHKQIERLWKSPAFPVAWPLEQKGMQGGEDLSAEHQSVARRIWLNAMEDTIERVHGLRHYGLHKSVANRLLEPFMWHTVVVTGTAWENFFAQRCSPLAQPEIRVAAEAMKAAYEASTPTVLTEGIWHLPYVDGGDFFVHPELSTEDWVKISAARCARVSYLTQDGERDISADLKLYDRLVTANPPHWSPLEHVATPDANNVQSGDYSFYSKRLKRWETVGVGHLPVVGNLLGWRSLRVEVEAEQGVTTYR